MAKHVKKAVLQTATETAYGEVATVITTIIGAVSAKGQRKKILENAEVQKILARYDLHIDE
ncbi:MAG: hypothetical protein IJ206_13035 [Oscillospiraceae bacterium]|nr:hypothetical protein [Oscillospiraceae bacterium]